MRHLPLNGRTLDAAFSEVHIDVAESVALRLIANTELDQLEQHNCARYNLARGMTQRWIDAGRRR